MPNPTFWKNHSRLSSSRNPRDSLRYFEISVPRHIRFTELRKKINWTTTIHKWTYFTPEVRYSLKILWKRGKIAPEEQFLLFSTIYCYLLLDFHVKIGTRFLLEISEVEITRVDCMLIFWFAQRVLHFKDHLTSFHLPSNLLVMIILDR